MNPMFPSSFDFSQSSLQDYADCPRRFQLRYLDRMAWPALEAEPVGQVEARQQEGLFFHRLVQQHLLGLPSELLSDSARSPDLQRWWQNYLLAGPRLEGYRTRPELTLFSKIGQHRLLAKCDLIAFRSGEAVIFDWKTLARRPSNESLAARWQTRTYRALLARAGSAVTGDVPFSPDSIRMIYWFAEYPSDPAEFTYDVGQFGIDWADIEKLIAEISTAGEFPMTGDRARCRFCLFRSHCDRGERAAVWDASATELDAAGTFDIRFEEVEEIEL